MYQGTLEGLWDHAESCQVSRVGSLLTEALSQQVKVVRYPSAQGAYAASLNAAFTVVVVLWFCGSTLLQAAIGSDLVASRTLAA
jgi:hypothetical protein